MRLNKGIPVRFTPNDRYKFVIDTTGWTKERQKRLRALLEAINADWTEGYYLALDKRGVTE